MLPLHSPAMEGFKQAPDLHLQRQWNLTGEWTEPSSLKTSALCDNPERRRNIPEDTELFGWYYLRNIKEYFRGPVSSLLTRRDPLPYKPPLGSQKGPALVAGESAPLQNQKLQRIRSRSLHRTC